MEFCHGTPVRAKRCESTFLPATPRGVEMLRRRTRVRALRRGAWGAITVALVIGCVATAVGGAATQAGGRASGVGKPPAGTGIGTDAAMSNPDCDRDAGSYGRSNFVYQGSGGVCVVPFKAGSDNGGATAPVSGECTRRSTGDQRGAKP